MTSATNKTSEKREVDGQLYYDIDLEAPVRGIASCDFSHANFVLGNNFMG